MRKPITTLIFLCILICVNGQTIIDGYVSNAESNEALIGAVIYSLNDKTSTISNDYGYFSLKANDKDFQVIVSYIGYSNDTLDLNLTKQIHFSVKLNKKQFNIAELEVNASKNTNLLQSNQYAPRRLNIENIKAMPMMMGEADVIKAIQLQSGVKTLGDGSSGMFVRGGSSDQNLILIDEAPIYNPAHMFGLLSVFNPDAVNSVSFYKSNMPAQYGGRTSAVIDCKMKEGNSKNHHFSAGISLLSTSVYANGPIVKEQSSYLVSFRKSITDLIFNPVQDGAFVVLPAFYDINVKLNTKIGKNDRLFFSFYDGKDHNKSYDGFDNQWKNTTATLRWNRSFGQKWYSNVSLISSRYVNDLKYTETDLNYSWRTGVQDLNLKIELDRYFSTNNRLKFGANTIYHQFTPGESNNPTQSIPHSQAIESAFFALQDITLWDKLGINYGLRFSTFQSIGEASWYEYDNLFIKEHHNEKGVYHTNFQVEPRISLNYKLNDKQSLKGGYARNAQYMQVLENNTLSYTSLETWFPANPNIAPLLSDVFSAGWFYEPNSNYFFSAEVYYKSIMNIIDYVDHAQLIDNPYVEAETLSGDGEAYGIELEVKKQTGKLTGSISYSYSRALQTIEGINNNESYSSLHDIPHDLRILTSYHHNKYWSYSAFWTYNTGRAATFPIGFYKDKEDYNRVIPIYSERNGSRFPSYHRLDLSAQYSTKAKGNKSYWDYSLGVFNAYARENPTGYFFSDTTISPYSYIGFLPNFSVKFNY